MKAAEIFLDFEFVPCGSRIILGVYGDDGFLQRTASEISYRSSNFYRSGSR